MASTDLPRPVAAAARSQDSTVFVALELSRKSWLVGVSAPGADKISKYTVAAGDGPGLLALLAKLQEKAAQRLGRPVAVVTIQECLCQRTTGSSALSMHHL